LHRNIQVRCSASVCVDGKGVIQAHDLVIHMAKTKGVYNSGPPAPVALDCSGPVPKSNSRCSLPLVKASELHSDEEPIAALLSFPGVEAPEVRDTPMLRAYSESMRMPAIQQSHFVSSPCQVFEAVGPLQPDRPTSGSAGSSSPAPQSATLLKEPTLEVGKQDEDQMKTLKYQARKARILAERIERAKHGIRDYASGVREVRNRQANVPQQGFSSDPSPVQQCKFQSDGVKSAPLTSPRGDPSEFCCTPPSIATSRSSVNPTRLRRIKLSTTGPHIDEDYGSVRGTSSRSPAVASNAWEGRSTLRLSSVLSRSSRQTSAGSACLDSPSSIASSRSCVSERWKATGSEGCESERRMWTHDPRAF